jgi:hypothetical protein
MLSPRFIPGGETTLTSSDSDKTVCQACHRAGGPAPTLAVAAHPNVAMYNIVETDAPGYLPLFDSAGRESSDGQVTCRTCHLAHGRLDLLRVAASGSTMSQQDLSSMRLNVRPFVGPNICTQCHGQEARLRFLMFHDLTQREKLRPG